MKFLFLSKEEIAKVDDLAIGKYGIKIEKLMENAGRGMARFVSDLDGVGKIFIFYGKGNNGGDGLVAARHLKIYGFDVCLVGAVSEDKLNETGRKELEVLKKMGLEVSEFNLNDISSGDVIIDGLLGYNLKGNPRGKYANLIEQANAAREKGVRIVSFDLPSGVDATSGKGLPPFIQADYVLALAMPKKGLIGMDNIYVVNIGVPNEVYREMGFKVRDYFKEVDVVKIS